MKKQQGFTLIELLVVIAVIGILASVVMASLNSARVKARNAKRISDLKQISLAVEMYYNDYGTYPYCNNGANGSCNTTGGLFAQLNTLAVVPTYIQTISNDPRNSIGQYGYYYSINYRKNGTSYVSTGSNTDYILATRLENSSAPTFFGWDNSSLNYIIGN